MSEPSTTIGTALLFENDRVRVWEMTLDPGEACEPHTHVNDYLFVYTGDSELEVRIDGAEPRVQAFPDGFVQYTDVGRDRDFPVHSVRNVSDVRHRQILVELLGDSRTEHLTPPETNAATLAGASAPGIASVNSAITGDGR